VLEDAGAAGADRFLLGGDYTLFGAWPVETLDRLEALDATWIRGNGERWTADPRSAPDQVQHAIAACRELLGEGRVRELAALPQTATLEDGTTLCCHASPRSDMEGFFPQPHDGEEDLLAGLEAERLVFGHTHLQFQRRSASGIRLVNPGSVGMPFDGDLRAAYGLLRPGREVEPRRVAYDHGRAAAETRARYPAWGEVVARRIELARFDA
jgi:diadenosine tetraphosphatase ApaH/serine/threonine PP2A family protein phosphatase